MHMIKKSMVRTRGAKGVRLLNYLSQRRVSIFSSLYLPLIPAKAGIQFGIQNGFPPTRE